MRVPRGEAAQRLRQRRHRARARADRAEEVQVERALERGAPLIRGHGAEERVGRRRRRRGRVAVEQRDELRRAQVQAQHAAPRGHRARALDDRDPALGHLDARGAVAAGQEPGQAGEGRLVAHAEQGGGLDRGQPRERRGRLGIVPEQLGQLGVGRAVGPRGDLRGLARAQQRAREQPIEAHAMRRSASATRACSRRPASVSGRCRSSGQRRESASPASP